MLIPRRVALGPLYMNQWICFSGWVTFYFLPWDGKPPPKQISRRGVSFEDGEICC